MPAGLVPAFLHTEKVDAPGSVVYMTGTQGGPWLPCRLESGNDASITTRASTAPKKGGGSSRRYWKLPTMVRRATGERLMHKVYRVRHERSIVAELRLRSEMSEGVAQTPSNRRASIVV